MNTRSNTAWVCVAGACVVLPLAACSSTTSRQDTGDIATVKPGQQTRLVGVVDPVDLHPREASATADASV